MISLDAAVRAAAALVQEASMRGAGTAYVIYIPDLVGGLTERPVERGEWRLVLVSGRVEAGAQPGTAARTQGDPVVSRALRLLHEHPAHRWSVAELASCTAVSRSSLARRFTALVGEAPMTYLTGWRITLAADLLRETDDTLESIARRVGYGNAFALSVAFKRVRGLSPTAHRRSAVTSAQRPSATA